MRLQLLVAVVMLGVSVQPSIGQTCQNTGSVPIPDAGGAWLVTTAPSCTLTSGGYIRKQSTGIEPEHYKIHFAATVTGGCQTRVLQCVLWVCKCTDNTYYVRNLGTSEVDRNGALLGYVAAQGSVQSYDTSIPTGTVQTGWLWKPTVEGKFTFTSTIKTSATVCNLSPTQSPGTPFVANVLKCHPYYNYDGPLTVHMPQGPVQIYVPPTLSDLVPIATSVAADYTAGLAGTGITVTRSEAPCSGAGCINVMTGDTGGDCSTWHADWDSHGVITQAQLLYPANYMQDDPTALRRFMAHELGHLLGLGESLQADCFAADSIMSSDTPCTAQFSGPELSPTPGDLLPIASSVYSSLPRATCGF